MKDFKKRGGKPSASFVVGSVALLFLIIGYQAALFISKASVARIVANHDHPDTVFVYLDPLDSDTCAVSSGGSAATLRSEAGSGSPDSSLRSAPPTRSASGPLPLTSRGWLGPGLARPASSAPLSDSMESDLSAEAGGAVGLRPYSAAAKRGWTRPGSSGTPANTSLPELAPAGHSMVRKYDKAARDIWRANTKRRYESFRFDPNTVSVDDLMRLGFSQKQAESIDNYRKKGGRFRRKSDFAKSYVVEDSVYRRLEKYIDIPKIDINRADSAAFETLPGIGKFFAAKMVSYRRELGGYSYPEQLMDIWHFDQEKYDGLKDLIKVGPSEPYPLWTLPENELARHPYIDKRAAHGIIIFRENSPVAEWTVGNIIKAGILDPGLGEKLARCKIAPAPSP